MKEAPLDEEEEKVEISETVSEAFCPDVTEAELKALRAKYPVTDKPLGARNKSLWEGLELDPFAPMEDIIA